MARVKERATQQEVRLGQLEGELVRKDKLFSEIKEELTSDVVGAHSAGFEDAMAQVAYVHPGWTFPKLPDQENRRWAVGRRPRVAPSLL